MKWLIFAGAPAMLAGGMYLHGPARTGETYARPVAEVEHVLQTMAYPDFVEQQFVGLSSSSSRREAEPGKSVTYYFFAKGQQVAKFVAEYKAVDPAHTKVWTSMTMSDGADAAMKQEFMPMAKMFASVGKAALVEQVDSRLEQRPFNPAVVRDASAGFALANMGEIQQGVAKTINENAKMTADWDKPSQPAIVPGRPMVDSTVE